MKIFLTGPWWDTGSWTEYVAAGFTQLGHDVRTFIYSRELNRRPGFRERLRRKLLGPDRFQIERLFASAREDNINFMHGIEEFALTPEPGYAPAWRTIWQAAAAQIPFEGSQLERVEPLVRKGAEVELQWRRAEREAGGHRPRGEVRHARRTISLYY